MDVISFFHAIILDTLQSLQSEFQAGDGEAKAFRPTKNLIINFVYAFSFSVKSLIITTLHGFARTRYNIMHKNYMNKKNQKH